MKFESIRYRNIGKQNLILDFFAPMEFFTKRHSSDYFVDPLNKSMKYEFNEE